VREGIYSRSGWGILFFKLFMRYQSMREKSLSRFVQVMPQCLQWAWAMCVQRLQRHADTRLQVLQLLLRREMQMQRRFLRR
jgi:hypothetical protein